MVHSRGVPVVQREFPSLFDMFGGNTPTDPEGFDADTEFQRAVDLARDADVAVVVVGEWQNMIGENASRSSLELTRSASSTCSRPSSRPGRPSSSS